MKTFIMPGTEWDVSQLAYGCGAIGGSWDRTPLDDTWRNKAFMILDAAIESGINFFDHADIYTFGKSEQVFGEWLAARPKLRESIYIQSKCGIQFANMPHPGDPQRYDFSCEHILEAVDGSLQRLGIDYLDSLLLHRPDMLVEPEEVAKAFDQLSSDGKVRQFGISNHNVQQMELLRKYVRQPLVANQLQMSLPHPHLVTNGIYTNMATDQVSPLSVGILEYCRLHGILVQAWSPMGGGGFHKKPRLGRRHPKQELLEAVQVMATEKGCTPGSILLAWVLRHPAKVQPILGTLTPERLKESVAALDIELSRKEWYRLTTAALGENVP